MVEELERRNKKNLNKFIKISIVHSLGLASVVKSLN